MNEENKNFGRLRAVFWPVYRSEFKKVGSMLLLLFLLCTCYSILRNVKDTLILTAKGSGAEAIPFLKVWGMLPGAFLATWVFTRLRRKFSRERVFYIVLSGFLAYFALFAFVFYPYRHALHLESLGDFLTGVLPAGFKGMIAMIRNWTFTSFYVISELWAVQILGVLFWGFCNDVTSVDQAKRTYGLLNVGSNIAPIVAGTMAIFFTQHVSFSFLSFPGDGFRETLVKMTLIVSTLGILAMVVFYFITNKVVKVPTEETDRGSIEETSSKKVKISLRDSIRYILRSPYLICLACIVLGYNISINITDILWKEQLKKYFTDPNEMLSHMNMITVGIGALATCGAFFLSAMINRFGWTFGAILTPTLMTFMAIGFFSFLFFGNVLSSLSMGLLGLSPLALTVYFGSLQNCLSKAGKYSVFDATKEMAFLPLDAESRLKGKTAIDGLGSGIGKSGASLTYQGLFILFGGVASSTPYMAVILGVVLVAWITSVVFLGSKFKEMTTGETKQEPVLVP